MQNTHLASVYECSSLDKRVGEWCKNHAKNGLSSHTAFCQTFPKGIKKNNILMELSKFMEKLLNMRDRTKVKKTTLKKSIIITKRSCYYWKVRKLVGWSFGWLVCLSWFPKRADMQSYTSILRSNLWQI